MSTSNITDVANAVENLNVSFEPVNATNILPTAIQHSNSASDGWTGLLVFLMMSASVIIYMIVNKENFRVFSEFNIIFMGTSVTLDLGLILLVWSILQSYQIYIFIFTLFFVMAFWSLLQKDLTSRET